MKSTYYKAPHCAVSSSLSLSSNNLLSTFDARFEVFSAVFTDVKWLWWRYGSQN
jgi:hypothetical protein